MLPALGIVLFALAVYLARGRRRRTLRTTGWCFVLIGAALLLIRRVAGDAVVNGLVKIPSNKTRGAPGVEHRHLAAARIAVAMIAYGIVIVASAWLAGPTRPATEIRKALAPSLRDSPAVAYCTVGGLLVLLVLIGPTPAFRQHRLGPGVRRAARVRRHDAPTPDRSRVRRHPARPRAA